MGSLSDTPLPTRSKMSRYRASQESSKMESEAQHRGLSRPTTSGTNNSSDQNPSIARSMSRYRRNRAPEKVDACATMPPIPARAKHQAQAAPPVPAVSSRAQAKADEEERLREIHRLDAMAQLTGDSRSTSDSVPSRSTKPEKQARQPKREEKIPTVKAHEIKKDRQAETNPSKGVRAAENPQRRSFFQKVLQSTKKDSDQPKYIVAGGVPGIDAPVSAVNAGERKVSVQYGDVSTELVVTPLTTVQNLLHSAYELLSKDINPETFILIESFCQVGLERPLRRYEHVRDVMNSWAHDADNRLIIIPPSGAEALAQVDANKVPSKKPAEATVYMYYSQRPRKWDKRYVTLRSDGQVVIGKKGNSTVTNICHLSDFDVYAPNARALAKEIKPPKKICFAIKSQQKSSMFLSTENFLHFFATSDRAEADKWYRVVQGWRSWYLVNELGAGRVPEPEIPAPIRSVTQKGHRQANEPALERQVVRAEPLINQATSATIEPARPSTATMSPFARLKREYGPSNSSYQPLSLERTNTGSDESTMARSFGAEEGETGTFSPTGLLGRNYTQRQKVMREREKEENQAKADPFTGMLAGGQNSRSNTMTHAPDMVSPLARTHTTKKSGKPLVDLTPVFQEAPQHLRKGRPVHVDQGPLIDAATNPDLGGQMAVPSATTWRRPDHEVSSQAPHRSNTVATTRHESAPLGDNISQNPFEPHSLLSRARVTNGSSKPIGHGVATGDRLATRPMLDMAAENPFAEGSLLRKL